MHLTPFVGRVRQLEEIDEGLRLSRLVTLTGAGGSGKTRLAVKAADMATPRCPGGVWFVELATETNAANVLGRLATALGVEAASHGPLLDAIVARLQVGPALLVLDSCEHLVEECAVTVSSLLGSCPELRLLCTSQEPLGLSGEVIRRVPGLAVPDGSTPLSIQETLASEAVQLFLDRARLVNDTFVLTEQNANAVVQICRQLDGMPLAIELAAARCRLLSASEILGRLENRFSLLVGSSRTALARHQTLRATVAWSYEQLAEDERTLFRRLSVFSGGFTVSAVERVAIGDSIASADVLHLLERLADRAMIVPEPGTADRYRLLESLRQYGAERLADWEGESDRARQSHCDHYLEFAVTASEELRGPSQIEWMRRLDGDADNIRLALKWAIDQRSVAAMEAVGCLYQYWIDRGDVREGIYWCELALALEGPSVARESVLLCAARLAWTQSNISRAKAFAEQVRALAIRSGDRSHLADAYALLSGTAAYGGELDQATPLQEEALKIRQGLGDAFGEVSSLNNLGLLSLEQGDTDRALALLTQAVEAADQVLNPRLRGTVHESLARACLMVGELGRAEYCLKIALGSVGRESRPQLATCFEDFFELRSLQGKFREALVFAGHASSLRVIPGAQQPASWRIAYEHHLSASVKRLAPKAAALALLHGSRMNTGDAIELALGTAPAAHGLLTEREWQIAELVWEGLSNRGIAGRLGLSLRTADAHVEHIRNKLGVHSRTQVAVWVAAEKAIGTGDPHR